MRLETIKGIRGKRKVLGIRRAFNSSAWEFKKGNPDPNVLDPDTIAFRISGANMESFDIHLELCDIELIIAAAKKHGMLKT